ncbi:hypothetical protein M9Y10_037879 [Tritrichomonas musculus]|uniref:Glycosyl hydrolase family 13 catalytic domain-containing protein n=1 Tax=Tritrichomonas musculus TaxID=1915356 RepID=A0ABR2K7I8_9EUKA
MLNLHIEPPFWWSGMKNPHLQLFIRCDEEMNQINPQINAKDIKILETVIFPNPHYMAIYFDLTDAHPQIFDIDFNGTVIHYELKQRKPNSDQIQGFDSSDVVYLAMPDRFARHSDESSEVDNQVRLTEEQAVKDRIKKQEENKKKEAEKLKLNLKEPLKPTIQKPDDKDDGFYHIPVEKANYKKFIDPVTNTERVEYQVNRQDPNSRHGGNIRGIIDHLDYLFDLGITALWLTPIFDNDMPYGSYHGYAITDYYNVDPRFGTNSDLIELINKIHEKGNKYVMDTIFNHCGSNHIWYRDPPCSDWFNFTDKGVITTHDITSTFSPYASKMDWESFNNGCFVSQMPDLNQRNRHLAVYLTQNTIWWIEYAQINGIRVDTFPYCDLDFLHRWIDEIMNEYPLFNIVGETWIENALGVSYFQRGNRFSNINLPSIMDFAIGAISRNCCLQEVSFDTGLTQIRNHLNYDFCYANVFNLLRFLDNHDTDRFMADKPENIGVYKQYFTILLTIPGIPQLYYGTEIMMYGRKKISDGHIRLDFPGGWKNDKQNCFTAEGRTEQQNDFFNFMRTLLNWRKGNEVISKGKMIHFKPTDGIYLYQRSYNNKSAIIVTNGMDSRKLLRCRHYKEILNNEHLGTDIFTKREIDFTNDFTLESREVLVLDMHK